MLNGMLFERDSDVLVTRMDPCYRDDLSAVFIAHIRVLLVLSVTING